MGRRYVHQPSLQSRTLLIVSALSGQDLITTAHDSLGYLVPSIPLSPEDDSIRAAWRSSSHACLDIPDFGSTISPRPSPTNTKTNTNTNKRRRMQSAPDILEFKTSPTTPSPTRRPHTIRTGRALIDLLPEDRNLEQRGILPFGIGTPVSSPAKRPLESPMSITRPEKRSGDDEVLVAPCPILRTPISSPSRHSQIIIIPHLSQDDAIEAATEPPPRSRIIKPLSLRSRLKLAARSIQVN
jgi:hypothetical protein